MTTRNTDVNLIIRAKNEAGQAITSVAEALKGLVSSADDAGGGVGDLATRIATLDKTYASLADKTNAVREATSRQASDLHSSNTAIEERRNLIATLTAGLATMKAQTDKAFIGPRDPGLAAQIKLTQARINEAERDLRKLTSAYEGNLGAVRAGRSTLLELTNATQAVAEAQDAAKTKFAETTAEILAQTEAARKAAQVTPIQQGINSRAGIGRPAKSAAGSANVFVSEDASLEADAKQLRAALDPLAAIQDRFNTSLARYRVLAGAGKISTQELAAAEAHLAAEANTARKALGPAGGGKPQLFGLKPYEVQNLSYQINDVVTGLASGQKLTQIIAQQGGQIFQLFPRAGGSILGFLTNPAVLAGVAAFGLLALSVKHAADDAERLRGAAATLNLRADGGQYNARDLAEQERALERVGASAKDAQTAMRAFLDASVAPDRIDQFTRATKATAQILGEDIPTAAKDVATAFTGGYDAIAAFDDKLNFLTEDQRKYIRALFEQGDAEKARTEALNIYSEMARDTANMQRGPWSEAVGHLAGAWDGLIQKIADTTVIKGTIAVLGTLAGLLDHLLGTSDNPGIDVPAGETVESLTAKIKTVKAAIAFNAGKGSDDIVASLVETLATLEKQLFKLKSASPDTKGSDPNSPAAKASADKIANITQEDELQRLRDAGAARLLTATEQRRRAELAGIIAVRGEADAAVAAAERTKAVEHEKATIAKETAARVKAAAADAKRAQQEEEQAIGRFERRVIGAEGGNKKNAAGSGAAGYGQFTPDTYRKYFARVYPNSTLSDSQILETRFQEKIASGIIDAFTRDNAAAIRGLGKAVNGANLYTLHLFGNTPLGRAALGNDNVPIDQLVNRYGGRNAGSILSQNAGYLRTEKGKGAYRTAGQLRTFLGAKVGDISTDDTVGDAQRQATLDLDKILEEATQKQDNFNLSVREGNDERQRSIDAMKAEAGLTGTALLDAERKIAVDKAEFDLRKRVADANRNRAPGAPEVVVSDAQIADTRRAEGEKYDAERAADRMRAELATAQRPSDELREQIDLLRQQSEYLRSIGENKAADAVDKQIDALNPKLDDAIEKLIEFYKALNPEQRAELGIVDEGQLDNIIAKLEVARQNTQQWGKVAGVSGKEIAQAFASGAAQSFTNFLNKVAAGKNVFKSLGESVLEFASNFASAVAQMILQLLAYAAAVAILKALGVPVPAGGGGGLGSLFGGGGGAGKAANDGASLFHSGGIAGQMGGRSRVVPMNLFAGATRYHRGGIAGLAPDEVGAVLRKGEEVLTEDNPRHRNNQGGPQAESKPPTVINVFDRDEAFRQMLMTPSGSKVFIRHVSENAGAINAALGR